MADLSGENNIWGDRGGGDDGYVIFDERTRKSKKAQPVVKEDDDAQIRYTNDFSHVLPPTDPYNMIYIALFLAGVGFLLPYNSFIMAVDYFKTRYPGTTIVFDMSTVYIITAFVAVLINNLLVEALTLDTRIKFGYVTSMATLLFVAICEIWWETFGLANATSYTINLIAVAIVAFGCTVQQSSFYGYTSMLPSRYTQAVMAGESAAGFWVSLNRITTKWLLPGHVSNTLVFFIASALLVALCCFINMFVRETEFIRYYVRLCQESRHKITLEPTEDSGLMDPLDTGDDVKTQYGFLKLQTSPPPTTEVGDDLAGGSYSAFSFANPVYEPTTTKRSSSVGGGEDFVVEEVQGTKYKVEDVVIRMRPSVSGQVYPSSGTLLWNSIKRGWWARWEVSRLIWEDMLAIGLAYFLTLCLYPGIMSEINSCHYGSWLPVILMALFNGFDLLGKICSGRPIRWGRMLLPFNVLRMIAVALSLLVMVNAGPGGELEYCAMVLSVFLGITNGIFGSVPMIIAPAKVPEQHREISGNIMTLSYNMGLTAGSIAAYFLNSVIQFESGCPIIPAYPFPINATKLATTAATVVTVVTTMVSSTLMGSTMTSTTLGPTMPLAVLNISTSLNTTSDE